MFKLTVVTPEKRLAVDQEIDEVTLPGYRGELNVLPGHAFLITILETGFLKWKLKGGAEHSVVVSGGYCEIHPNGVEILAEIADAAEDINVDETNKALASSENRLLTETLDDDEFESVQRDIARRHADLEAVKALR